VLVNICGGDCLGIHTVSEAVGIVNEAVGGDANVIFGAVIDPEMGESVRITVIATGFGHPTVEETSTEAPSRVRARRESPWERLVSAKPLEETAEPRVPVGSGLLKERWERAHGQESLDVPAFIRKQMD
jgi:cell division protein FtsZ